MLLVLERDATITGKGQTSLPKPIRDALGLHAGDRIRFRVDERGVSVHRVEEEGDDPALEAFLSFLAKDIATRPETVLALSPTLASRIAELTEGVDVDVEEDIEGDSGL